MSKAASGFTLIELIAVIVILGVVALATTEYITFGTQVYVQSADRQRVLTEGRFLVERLSRELKQAIPNSIRSHSSNACIEFVPFKSSGAYRTDATASLVPIQPNPRSSGLDVIAWTGMNFSRGDRLFIYPTSASDVYDNSNNVDDKVAIIDSVTATLPDPDPSPSATSEYTITLQNPSAGSGDRFSESSPENRYYTADRSVNYCFVRNNQTTRMDVFRFEVSNFGPVTAVSNGSSGVIAGAVLMAEGLTNDISTRAPFTFANASRTRNAVVTLYLEFAANRDENMFFNHEVHIANVP